MNEQTESMLIGPNDLEHLNRFLVMEQMYKCQGITDQKSLTRQEQHAYNFASQWAFEVIKSLRNTIDHQRELLKEWADKNKPS